MRGEDFIEGFWDGSEWLYMIIWGVLPGLAAAQVGVVLRIRPPYAPNATSDGSTWL